MAIHVVVSTSPGELREDALRALDVPLERGDRVLHLPVNADGTINGIDSNAIERLTEKGLVPTQQASEFFFLAAAAYVADKLAIRSLSEDGWTREFRLYLPVADHRSWGEAADALSEALSFLSGDRWTLIFRPGQWRVQERLLPGESIFPAECVSLFSGGLDSCIGAIDLLASGRHALLVGHYGDALTPGYQEGVYRCLVDEHGRDKVMFFQARVRPEANGRGEYEETTRCRSILFISLGILAASAYNNPLEILIPENGYMSLNIPLTPARLGSLSTRTTHPYFLQMLRVGLGAVGLTYPLRNPYQFMTKGEMVEGCADQPLLRVVADRTMSCAHPSVGRWEGMSPEHCGYCVPCLIRRAALHRVGLDQPGEYTRDVQRELIPADGRGANLRAFQIALQRFDSRVSSAHVLKAGPLATESLQDFARYVDVFRRGLEEVRELLRAGNAR